MYKSIKRLMFLGYLLVFFISGCGMCDDVEIYRKTSPDGIVDAVILTRDCGATTAVTYFIYIVPKGSSVKNEDPIFTATHVAELKAEWADSKMLSIKYDKADIFKFTNSWLSKRVDNFKYKVIIQESRKY